MKLLSQKYTKPIISFFLFFSIVFVGDRIIGYALKAVYFSNKSGDYYKTTFVVDQLKSDVVIIGSSRASHHYIPQIFEDSLKLSCYNAGRDGTDLLYHYAIFKSITQRYKPKIVLLDIDASSVIYDARSYEKLSVLLPYCERNTTAYQLVLKKSKYEKIKLLSAIYPFNSTLITSLKGLNVYSKQEQLKGYLPLYGQMVTERPQLYIEPVGSKSIDTFKIKIIKRIITDCKSLGITLHLVQSPRYLTNYNKRGITILDSLCKTYKQLFMNFLEDSVYLDHPEYFKDGAHLNDIGAKILTKNIIGSL